MKPRAADGPPDEYTSDEYRWWHLSTPSPELVEAVDSGWIAPPGHVLDLGCGLGVELGDLARRGFEAVGVDSSATAIERARSLHHAARFEVGNVLALPFDAESFDVLLDRGCFHYLPDANRGQYEREAWRVLRPGGRFLLRACLTSAGVRDDLPADLVTRHFSRWAVAASELRSIPSDTRTMEAVVARFEKPD